MSQDGAQGRYAGGAVAGGRYQLRDLLGEGGMASVYLAYDSALDRQVAIETLHADCGASSRSASGSGARRRPSPSSSTPTSSRSSTPARTSSAAR
ncbi:hypothetical protein SMICM17S_13036 [Streptomyces microflavus]